MNDAGDIEIIRGLAEQYAEIAAKPIQDERRDLWRRHNSLERTRPLIYCRWFACWGEHPWSEPACEDPFWQGHEAALKRDILQDRTGDDTVIEPWFTQRAAIQLPESGHWGVAYGRIPSNEPGGAWKYDPPLKKMEDIGKLAEPHHAINEEATERHAERLEEAVGDILPVVVDRSPAYQVWRADLSTDLAYLRGLEQMMWDMTQNPDWLHELLAFMRDGVLRAQQEAEEAGDWRLFNHQNQAIPYAQKLPDPAADGGPVTREQLWVFCAAQEFAQVSPQMHDEFMFQYQMPIMEKFGLAAYGCCEDLTHKIDMLRQLPNLRRIAVTPNADVARSAEQIRDDYVFSWRPNPANMVCCGFDEEKVRRIISEAMAAAKGCHVDITLKDVQTVEGDFQRLEDWVRIVRDVTEEYG